MTLKAAPKAAPAPAPIEKVHVEAPKPVTVHATIPAKVTATATAPTKVIVNATVPKVTANATISVPAPKPHVHSRILLSYAGFPFDVESTLIDRANLLPSHHPLPLRPQVMIRRSKLA